MNIIKHYKKLLAGALVGLLAAPQTAAAQSEYPVFINGSLINWYYYGRDIHEGTTGWCEQSVGLGTADNPYNYGLMQLGVNPNGKSETDSRKLWVNDFPIRNHILYSNAAGVFTGDAYYSFFISEQGWEENMDSEYGSETYVVKVRKWTWDVDAQGKYTNVKYEQVATMTTQPIDLTYDPLYDKVYGVFYSGSTYKFGTLDMETFKVNYISKEGLIYGAPRCIAINSKGELYAIDASGYVYKVNKKDGEMTTVGNVGFKSQSRPMSATFDYRTDKLYWIGFMNDGKNSADPSGTNTTATVAEGGRDTGLYEVNTETGVATLIAQTDFADVDYSDPLNPKVNKYGKLQMTGIYVEDAFTKKDNDLVATLVSAPAQLKAAQQGLVRVLVKNIGLQKVLAKNYVVKLYVNGELAATIDRDSEPEPLDNLESGKSLTISIPFTTPAKAGKIDVYAEVAFDDDQELRNNKTEAEEVVVLADQQLPTVVLKGEASGNGIALSWENPAGHLIDGAEDYAAFTYDGLGDWTMYDGDKGYTQTANSWNDAVSYPNSGTPKAFIVFNPEKSGINLTGSAEMFKPHSGDQFFAAWWTAVPDNTEAGAHQVPNDDYMVSPELNGEAQTVTFYARGYKGSTATGYETEANYPELMRVLYTLGDGTDPTSEDYVVVKDTFQVNNLEWTKYSVQLPAGAKHFALHCCSQEGFVLMIDDIEFMGTAQAVTAYNIYRNGSLVKTVGADVTTYTDSRARQSDIYTVAAVYGDTESAASNEMSLEIIAAGIGEILADTANGTTAVYDLRGQRVSGMLRPGIYVVRQGNKTRKVVIR